MYSVRNLLRTATAVVFFLTIASLVLHETSNAAASKSSAPTRGYYLTQNTVTGGQADLTDGSECAVGYHMASVYEIHEPANLTYNTSLGITVNDSGSGPPIDNFGWIRTGAASAAGNCNAWSDSSPTNTGTTVALTSNWNTAATLISPWTSDGGQTSCSALASVWCVQD